MLLSYSIMQMNSKELLTIKKKFKDILKDKQVYDVVLFGSFVKGKIVPRDIDVVILSDKNNFNVDGFHISVLNVYDFNNVCLFKYDLSGLSASQKVSCVNFLRGKKGEKGLVFDSGGEWISNQVFFCPVFAESVFERFFINKKIKFKKFFCLID